MSNTRKNHARDKFTAEMQDEQAKGKEPFDDPEENKNLDGEVFISQAQRRFALQILDDPESYNRSTTHRRSTPEYRVYQLYAGDISMFYAAFSKNLYSPLPRVLRRRTSSKAGIKAQAVGPKSE
ncbi:hypothetical protein PG993_014258 [Apiospora rasikravindrae]|uniref:Uncharacterized protein n=1 Tax=Apiospora rasikravindrae TaxID=990691 RepID=A0ABR1RNF0_9PEZI